MFQNKKKLKTGTDVPKSDRTGVTKMGTCVPFKKNKKQNRNRCSQNDRTGVPKVLKTGTYVPKMT